MLVRDGFIGSLTTIRVIFFIGNIDLTDGHGLEKE